MPFDVTTPETPGWWLVRLVRRLQDRRASIDILDRYFRGQHPLPYAEDSAGASFYAFQRLCRSNYLALVVEAPLERMRVVGFRAGPDDKAGDKSSSAIWQAARMDADQVLVHRTMLSLGRAYVIVGPHPRKRGKVLVTAEHPSQVITEAYPEDPREVRAALKMFTDPVTGKETAYVYLPHGIYRYRSRNKATADPTFYTEASLAEWEVLTPQANPTAPEVPVVEFANRPSVLGVAVSEFGDVIDIQDRINQTLLHRLVSEKFASWRQTAILNLEFDEDDDGNPIAPDLPAEPGVAWLLQGENLKMWQSEQTSTKDILSGVEADIRDLAAITRTPPHYLLNSIVNASGDALKSAETGLVAKVREHMDQAGESWEQVIALAHRVAKTPGELDVSTLQTIWADPESRSLAEVYDAASKATTAGVPWRSRMELLGKTPQEIDRMEAERMADAMVSSLLGPEEPSQSPQAPAGGTETPPGTSDPEEAAA